MGEAVPLSYDRGQNRWKHCWNKDEADFVDGIGKCPKSLTNDVAEGLLQDAFVEADPFALDGVEAGEAPERLFAVHKGVVYQAVPTSRRQGSYHGFPWRHRRGRSPLPRELVEKLRRRAESEGHLREFERWWKEHGR